MNSRVLTGTFSRPVAKPGAAAQAILRLGLAPLWRLRTWRKRRLAIRELERLDEHLLADIGLDRGQIRFVIDGLAGTPAPTAKEPAPVAPAPCLDCGVAA